MKKHATRELLLITKATTQWHSDFDKNVDELMELMSKVDTEKHVTQSAEVLDVYHHALPENPGPSARNKRRTTTAQQRPFEFLTFRN